MAAIEAAKRIKANLEGNAAIEKLEEAKEEKVDVSENIGEEKEDSVGKTEDKQDVVEGPLMVKRTVDISASKYQRYISSEIFRTKLLDLLQMGRDEHFKMQEGVESDGGILVLEASSEELLELGEREIREVAESGRSSQAIKAASTTTSVSQSSSTPQNPTDKVFLGFDPIPTQMHTLRGKILGPQVLKSRPNYLLFIYLLFAV